MSWEVVLLDSLKLLYILNLRYVPDIFQGSKNIIHINFLVFSQWNAGDYSYIQGVNSPFDSLHIRRKLEQFWGTYFLLFVKHANYTTKSFASNYQWLFSCSSNQATIGKHLHKIFTKVVDVIVNSV